MKYKGTESGWFDWIYLDLENFEKIAKAAGLKLTLLAEDDANSFLVQLKKKHEKFNLTINKFHFCCSFRNCTRHSKFFIVVGSNRKKSKISILYFWNNAFDSE